MTPASRGRSHVAVVGCPTLGPTTRHLRRCKTAINNTKERNVRKLEPIDRNDRPLPFPNRVPDGFIITEKAMQEIRARAIPDGVAMVCQVTFIREGTDKTPEPEWTVTILRGRFEEQEFPEVAGVRFLFPDCT